MKLRYTIIIILILIILGKYQFDFDKLIETLPLKKTCSISPKHIKFNVSDMPIRKRFNIENPYKHSVYDVKIFIEIQGTNHKMVHLDIEREGATASEAGPEDSVIALGYKSEKYQGKIIYIRNLPPGDFGCFLTFNQSGSAIIWKPEYSTVDQGVGIQENKINYQDVIPEIVKSRDGVFEGMKVMLFKR